MNLRGRSAIKRWLRTALCCLLVGFATGCISSKGFWQKRMTKGGGTLTMSGEYQQEGLKPPLVLTPEQIKKMVAATETNGSIRVGYGENLQPQASVVARLLEETLTQTEKELTIPLPLRPHVHLLRLPNERRAVQFSMSFPRETNGWQTMPWMMMLTNVPPETGAASALSPEFVWGDLRDFPLQVFLIAHEAFEMHLIDPKELLVMGDVHMEQWFIRFDLKYHTRWFRDGLASYVGYKATQRLRRNLAEAGVQPMPRFYDAPAQPFSKLAKAKGKVFDWDQNSKSDYYAAATALFLIIEQRKGPEAISAIMRELPNVKFPNGKALRKLVQQKTGMDIRQVARTFEFPDLGLEARSEGRGVEVKSVAVDGWAAQGNIQKGDVLLEINGAPVAGVTEFELQIFNAMERGEDVKVTFSRNGERRMTEAMSLHQNGKAKSLAKS